MRLLLWELTHSNLLKGILVCIISNIWMYMDGWYKSDEYYMNFSLGGPNITSFLPFIPKIFSIIFGYYIIAAGTGGMAYRTRHVPLIICIVLYLIITFDILCTQKQKTALFDAIFCSILASTVPHYLLSLFSGGTSSSLPKSRNIGSKSSSNSTGNDFDEIMNQQREAYYKDQAEEQTRQAEINANAMGFHSADEARECGIEP